MVLNWAFILRKWIWIFIFFVQVGGYVGGTEAEEEVAERLLTLLSDSGKFNKVNVSIKKMF